MGKRFEAHEASHPVAYSLTFNRSFAIEIRAVESTYSVHVPLVCTDVVQRLHILFFRMALRFVVAKLPKIGRWALSFSGIQECP